MPEKREWEWESRKYVHCTTQITSSATLPPAYRRQGDKITAYPYDIAKELAMEFKNYSEEPEVTYSYKRKLP